MTLSSLKFVVVVLSMSLFGLACTSSTDPSNDGSVKMNTELTNQVVSGISGEKQDRVEGTVVEVRIASTRVLVSRMKFHASSDTSNSDGTKNVKTAPSVLVFEPGSTQAYLNASVPSGMYSKVKVEKHKFSSSEAAEYADDAVLGEFASPERITLIIEGFVTLGSTETAFTLTDDQTENLWIDFEGGLTVEEGGTANVNIVFDASVAFRDGTNILSPLDPKDQKDIIKNLKHALKIQNSN